MKSIAAVASARIASAIHLERSTSTMPAQTATPLVSASSAILIASPGVPENAAIARATRPGLNGALGGGGTGAVLNGLLGESGSKRGRAPRRAPAQPCLLADLVRDRTRGGL